MTAAGETAQNSRHRRREEQASCGLVIDRDVHAARVGLRSGRVSQGAVAVAAALN